MSNINKHDATSMYSVKLNKVTSNKLKKLKGKRMMEDSPIQDIKDIIPQIIEDNIDKYLDDVPSEL